KRDSKFCSFLNPPEIFFCSHFRDFILLNKNKVNKTASGKATGGLVQQSIYTSGYEVFIKDFRD
ncbi:hypothetical protein, partial [Kaistella sp.]|uniref:hypothetical protein n=1 Tax=Kaistella sp. TaxID=2782235 RepID=UPI00359F689A